MDDFLEVYGKLIFVKYNKQGTIDHSILGSADSLKEVSANENHILLGALFLLIMGIALALVPVIMYPILQRYHPTLALGYVVFRGALETFAYMATAMSWLLLVVLSQEQANASSPDYVGFQMLGNLLGHGSEQIQSITAIVFSLGALMFYYVLYQFKLIPKWL
ncbi:DUF4386 domain-containing protein [Paenibacillus athensensis]|uniref:DUF4386 domain-containing protein n=1 Tax=Paenibacillus athensensis TaxID=1967502 RepID=UPI00143033B1|nr:DUF4386 domain-containing protein [Paenibacillus athensensis]MCD1258552.1 DUF4386 domain-containing protein [Paenibacillus athensensis]